MVANPEVWWRLIPSCRLRRRGTSSGSLQPGGLLLKALVAQSCRLFITPWTVPTRLLCPWDFPGKNTGVDSHSLCQGIFLTQVSCIGRWILHHLNTREAPMLCYAMSDSLWPHRQQPTRLPRPWDSPGKNTGVGCHFLLQCMKVKSESEIAQSCPTLSDPMDCSLPGSSTHGIFPGKSTGVGCQLLLWCQISESSWNDIPLNTEPTVSASQKFAHPPASSWVEWRELWWSTWKPPEAHDKAESQSPIEERES